MSYLVLARKYRPSTFAEVVGQDHVTRTLSNAFASGRVHHAFLFCGPRGCGKTTLARIVGKALNCEARDHRPAGSDPADSTDPRGAEPCGTCSACTSISNGSSVDYQEMDGASNRGIDAIRELTEAVRYQPAVLRKKVYVIDEVHMLTTEAFNALLKTLEEPPPHVTFVLATTEPHKLPNTILSRCQRYDFKLVPASRLAQHLLTIYARESLAIEPGAVNLLVRESGGSVRDALSLCDQIISYVGAATITERHVAEVLGVADRSLTRALVHALASGDIGAALGSVESAIERGVDEIQVARAIVRYLRDLAVLQVAPDRPELIDAADDERAALLAESRTLERSRVSQMFERMLRCCDDLGKTLQPRLVLDCALIDVATVEPLVPLSDLIERLGELETRIMRGGGAPRAAARAPSKVSTAPAVSAPAGAGARPASDTRSASISGGSLSPAASPPSAAFARGTAPGTAASAMGPGAAPREEAAAMRASASREEAPMRASAPREEAPATRASAPREEAPATRASAPRDSADSSGRVAMSGAVSMPSSGPVSMQPSGPVPALESSRPVASGSGPHDSAREKDLPPPTMGIPSTPDDVLRAWNAVLAQLEARRKMSLLAPFQHARILKWTRDELELGYPVDLHSMGEMASDKGTLDELRVLVRELVPDMKSVKIAVRLLDAAESDKAGARSVLETSRERSSAERSKRETEAREHPITKHVLQTFGAQIKEIKTDV